MKEKYTFEQAREEADKIREEAIKSKERREEEGEPNKDDYENASYAVDEKNEIKEKPKIEWMNFCYENDLEELVESIESIYGKENLEVNKILNSLLEDIQRATRELPAVLNMLKEIDEMEVVDGALVENNNNKEKKIEGTDDDLISFNDFFQKIIHKINEYVKGGHSHFINELKGIGPLFHVNISKPASYESMIIKNLFFRSSKKMLSFCKHLKAGDLGRISEHSEELADKGGADIFYSAPRSAILPSIAISGFMEIASRDKNIQKPYFAFPKNKTFKYIDWESKTEKGKSLLELVNDYLEEPNEENKKILSDMLGEERFLIVLEDLKEAFLREIKNNKKEKIDFVIFDEAINHGTTREKMTELVNVVAQFILKKYNVATNISFFPPIYGGAWIPDVSFFDPSERYGIKRLSRKESPVVHKVAVLSSLLARLTGRVQGAEYLFYKQAKEIRREPLLNKIESTNLEDLENLTFCGEKVIPAYSLIEKEDRPVIEKVYRDKKQGKSD
jgi:hypothetical protein